VKHQDATTLEPIKSVPNLLAKLVGSKSNSKLAPGAFGPRPEPPPVVESLYKVEIRDGKNLIIPKKSRDFLYSLKPHEYLGATSDPRNPISARAVLHSSHPMISYAHRVKEDCLTRLRRGQQGSVQYKALSLALHLVKSGKHFDLQSRIEFSYIKFCLAEISAAKRYLSEALELSPSDLSDPSLSNGKPKAGKTASIKSR
jgi:hypothetical protein